MHVYMCVVNTAVKCTIGMSHDGLLRAQQQTSRLAKLLHFFHHFSLNIFLLFRVFFLNALISSLQ